MRFSRNHPAISPAEQEKLNRSHVLVLGCGGLGGAIIENLVRLGVGHITAVDGDSFDETNLNRQILSTGETLGMNKALAAKARARSINPDVDFRAVEGFFTEANGAALLEGIDLVMDALDSVPARLTLEKLCAGKGLSIVHGAVQGWIAQVAVVTPGSGLLTRLYEGKSGSDDLSCLAFTCAFCAALQCAEAAKLLCGRKVESGLLLVDLRSMDFETIDI